ncbi:hypothetical protein D9757_009806 [Collybiopsis confluens]|uniref:Uncharacterized protein n=1 Tax=Collybiopsis confluens TaxID=2823264 RepID=A0A8H5HG56_9AGAR|nr:hypothetical protein D9757_009806 [Collybiopsis confluens]
MSSTLTLTCSAISGIENTRSEQDIVYDDVPLDIIELIIHHAWALPLTTSERCHMMKSFVLVNFTWTRFFLRESSIHIHLPSGSYADRYQNILNGLGNSFAHRAIAGMEKSAVQSACKSITLHCIDPEKVYHPSEPRCLGFAHAQLSESAYNIHTWLQPERSLIPNFSGQIYIQIAREVPLSVLDVLEMNIPFEAYMKDVKRTVLNGKQDQCQHPDFWMVVFEGLNGVSRSCTYELLIMFSAIAMGPTSHSVSRGARRVEGAY